MKEQIMSEDYSQANILKLIADTTELIRLGMEFGIQNLDKITMQLIMARQITMDRVIGKWNQLLQLQHILAKK